MTKDLVKLTLASAAKINGTLHGAGAVVTIDRDLAAQLPGEISEVTTDDSSNLIATLKKKLAETEHERDVSDAVNRSLGLKLAESEDKVADLQAELAAALKAQTPEGGTSEQSKDTEAKQTVSKAATGKAKG